MYYVYKQYKQRLQLGRNVLSPLLPSFLGGGVFFLSKRSAASISNKRLFYLQGTFSDFVPYQRATN